MSNENSFTRVLRWMRDQTQFPGRRLEKNAELLILFAAAAGGEAGVDGVRFGGQTRDPAQTSAMKAHALRRSLVHFKCDNSAKV